MVHDLPGSSWQRAAERMLVLTRCTICQETLLEGVALLQLHMLLPLTLPPPSPSLVIATGSADAGHLWAHRVRKDEGRLLEGAQGAWTGPAGVNANQGVWRASGRVEPGGRLGRVWKVACRRIGRPDRVCWHACRLLLLRAFLSHQVPSGCILDFLAAPFLAVLHPHCRLRAL